METKVKSKTIGWVRLQKSKKGEYFYVVSLQDKDAGFTSRGVLRMDNEKIKAVKANDSLIGKEIVGYIAESTFNVGGAATAKTSTGSRPSFTPKPANKPTTPAAPEVADLDEF